MAPYIHFLIQLPKQATQDPHVGLDQIYLLDGYHALAIFVIESDAGIDQPILQYHNPGTKLILYLLWQRFEPGGPQGPPAHLGGLHVDHTTSTHRSRGGLQQIHDLKNHAHAVTHLNDLTAIEAQLLVIIQYRVHVLNPDSVHRPVEDDPLSIRGRIGSILPK